MYCKQCGTLNEEDAIYCKQCGNVIKEENLKKDIQEKNKNNKKVTKTKNKVKKIKPKKQKIKQKKVINKNKEKKGMTLFQKFLMFILFILVVSIIGIISFVGYKYYQNVDKVVVPNVIGLSYDQALAVLDEYNLEIIKSTIKTQDKDEEQIVLSQNKKAGTKVLKGSKVKVTIGLYEELKLIEDYVGQNIEIVKLKLDELGIKYVIEEEYNDEYLPGIVISQSIKEGSKVKENKKITLIISKEKEESVSTIE